MKTKFIIPLVLAALLIPSLPSFAAEPSPAATELKELVSKVQTKLREGKKTEADLGDELKEFDALLAKHKDQKTEEVAQILFMEAMLYNQVLENTNKGSALMAQLQRDFPKTEVVASLKQQEEAKKLRGTLVQGTKFPDFDEKDVAGKSLSN